MTDDDDDIDDTGFGNETGIANRVERLEQRLAIQQIGRDLGLYPEDATQVYELGKRANLEPAEALAVLAHRDPQRYAPRSGGPGFASLRPSRGGAAPQEKRGPSIRDHAAYANQLSRTDKRAMHRHLNSVLARAAAQAIGWECPEPQIPAGALEGDK